jgi:hemolysin III
MGGLLLAAWLLAGCAAPIGANLVTTHQAYDQVAANALRTGDPNRIIAYGVYAATLVLMYTASMVYHGLPRGRAKFVCRIIDHGAIFLLIAGSYTPLMMGALRGTFGWTLLVCVWTFALVGIILTAVSRVKYPTLCTVVYLLLGWLIIVGIKPLWLHMNHWGLFWIGAGGLAYTVGVAFFAADRLPHVVEMIMSAPPVATFTVSVPTWPARNREHAFA